MNKSIEIEHFNLVEYSVLMEVVAEYMRQYQASRRKFEHERHFLDVTDTVHFIRICDYPVKIELPTRCKPFWVKVRETKTKYKFKIWYAS
jgi:hypothetical protein